MAKTTKTKSIFFCGECGYESSGWLGRCPGCGAWNTFVEEKSVKPAARTGQNGIRQTAAPMPVREIKIDREERFSTGIGELDRVLGGGIVRGSLTLAAGEPGIGKSTLMLMLSEHVASERVVLYVSGEESVSQIKMRAQRLGCNAEKLFLVSETSYTAIEAMAQELHPDFLIIDSIQTMFDENLTSAPGSVSQVREITGGLMRLAKTTGISVLVVGHVTKDGSIAGPRVLEHMVDTVLYFEGERHLSYRILRSVKNRFGSTNEIGVFEMRDTGLEEVSNPSMTMLSSRPENVPGTAVLCTMEGSRPMLLEVQALAVENSVTAIPRRTATGVDYNRVAMILAVLEKRCGLGLGRCDVYVNMTGGIRVTEPACDLGIAVAVVSSYKNLPVADGTAVIGELGLTGEIRSVSHIEKRIGEAFRLGFHHCVIPAGNREQAQKLVTAENRITYASDMGEVIKACLKKERG